MLRSIRAHPTKFYSIHTSTVFAERVGHGSGEGARGAGAGVLAQTDAAARGGAVNSGSCRLCTRTPRWARLWSRSRSTRPPRSGWRFMTYSGGGWRRSPRGRSTPGRTGSGSVAWPPLWDVPHPSGDGARGSPAPAHPAEVAVPGATAMLRFDGVGLPGGVHLVRATGSRSPSGSRCCAKQVRSSTGSLRGGACADEAISLHQ